MEMETEDLNDMDITMEEVGKRSGKDFRRCSRCNRYTYLHGEPGYGRNCDKEVLNGEELKKNDEEVNNIRKRKRNEIGETDDEILKKRKVQPNETDDKDNNVDSEKDKSQKLVDKVIGNSQLRRHQHQ